MKKLTGFLAAFLLIFTFSLQLQAASYGVFLGVDGDKVGNKLKNYNFPFSVQRKSKVVGTEQRSLFDDEEYGL